MRNYIKLERRDDIGKKGGVKIEDTALFGKYQICRVIGTGRTGTVFLAVHTGLEEFRAIKRVAKSGTDWGRFRREALILKECRHPGIPIVYDLEEDENFCYLIEEYLEGESLCDLVNRLGYVSGARLIRYGIEVCAVVNHLHSAGNHPILYLDLQPKNLLVCREMIKLIDFDHAASLSEANHDRKRYGTAHFAAPEQYTDEPLDQRTDVYAIGALLYFMGTGVYPTPALEFPEHFQNDRLAVIIRRCLSLEKEGRYQTVLEVQEALKGLENGKTGVFSKYPSSSLKIALAGSKSGVGTTHLAIGLSVYLNNHGYPNVYEEQNRTGAVRALMAYHHCRTDQSGLAHIRRCAMKPSYGANVKLGNGSGQLYLYDYGTDLRAIRDGETPDLAILVCGGKWWELPSCLEAAKSLGEGRRQCLVFAPGGREAGVRLPKELLKYSCFEMPYFPDPFQTNPVTERFFQTILKEVLEGKGGEQRRKFGKTAANILRRIAR